MTERTPVSPAGQVAWGEPVEGVSVRLRADKTSWMTNETPTFKLDVRNQGKREFSTFQSQKMGRLEVDGVWYEWTGEIDLKSSWLPPGREYHHIRVSLGSDWKATPEWRDKNASAITADSAETTSRQAHGSFCAGNPRPHRETEATKQLRTQQSSRDRN